MRSAAARLLVVSVTSTGFIALARAALQQVARKPALPLVLVVVVVGFLLVQNRIDRRDPKLASAPVGAEPELDFGPTLGWGGALA